MAPLTLRIPILGGRLRRKKWDFASGGKVLRVLLGSYEREQTALFERLIKPAGVVLDIGAHVGYYTLLSADLAGPSGRVFAFEPEPKNAAFLKKHVQMNACANVTVVEAAVGDKNGTAYFDYGTGTGTGHLAQNGKLAVPVLTLDTFCAERSLTPTHLKIDVEGAEMLVFQGGRETIERARPVIFLSTHGPEIHNKCLAFLQTLNYKFEAMIGDDPQTATEVLCLPG
ncbi:MAG: FkbM family methyltransferase [Elusimicrobia bacterium]|nr:FkbM family methyltransferase [Elusimicrobiota bacterium]